jgi:hypothetical protein
MLADANIMRNPKLSEALFSGLEHAIVDVAGSIVELVRDFIGGALEATRKSVDHRVWY